MLRHALRRTTPVLKTATRGMPLVPMVIESSGMGERAFDIFSRLLKAVSYTHLTLPTILLV